jgi:hypothetical protein
MEFNLIQHRPSRRETIVIKILDLRHDEPARLNYSSEESSWHIYTRIGEGSRHATIVLAMSMVMWAPEYVLGARRLGMSRPANGLGVSRPHVAGIIDQ